MLLNKEHIYGILNREEMGSSHIDDYWWIMAGRQRLIYASKDDKPWLVLTYFVLKDMSEFSRFHLRPLYSTPEDSEDGSIILVDKLSGNGWDRKLLLHVSDIFSQRHPSWSVARWCKKNNVRFLDKCVIREYRRK